MRSARECIIVVINLSVPAILIVVRQVIDRVKAFIPFRTSGEPYGSIARSVIRPRVWICAGTIAGYSLVHFTNIMFSNNTGLKRIVIP